MKPIALMKELTRERQSESRPFTPFALATSLSRLADTSDTFFFIIFLSPVVFVPFVLCSPFRNYCHGVNNREINQ
jgi:hypothetical protein